MLLLQLIADEWKFLTFRPLRPDLKRHGRAYLAFGLFFALLAGIGRYWDNPRAQVWQHLGIGSVVYVFVLSLLLWVLLAPLRPRNWSYRTVLVFVALTSPPALLYAIPVERFLPLPTAQTINVCFLAVVATWRVALLALFLARGTGLSRFTVTVATALPLVLIVFVLASLNLERVVFDFMSGIREDQKTGNDAAYGVLFLLSMLSFILAPILIICYGWLVHRARASS